MVQREMKKRKKATIIKPRRPGGFDSGFANIGAQRKAQQRASFDPTPFRAERRPDVQHTTALPGGKVRIEQGVPGERGHTQRVLSERQFGALREARKTGGRSITDPQVRQAFLEQQRAVEAQRLASPAFRAEQERLRMAEQAKGALEFGEEIPQLVSGGVPTPPPEGFDWGDVIKEAGTKAVVAGTGAAAVGAAAGLAGGPAAPISVPVAAGGAALLAGGSAFVYSITSEMKTDVQQSTSLANTAYTGLNEVSDALQKGTIPTGLAVIRWNQYKNDLGQAHSNAKQQSTENPLYFLADGEDELAAIQMKINHVEDFMEEEFNRRAHFPGVGRQALAVKIGGPE